jgi:hypothetical protein
MKAFKGESGLKHESVWKIISTSFNFIQGIYFGIAGVLATVITWQFDVTHFGYLRWVIPVLLILLFAVITLVITLIKLVNDKEYITLEEIQKNLKNINNKIETPRSTPKVIRAVNNNNSYILLLEPSEVFSYDILASIYIAVNEVEILVAIGQVINIQDDKRIQVRIIGSLLNNKELLESLQRNDADTLQKTIVKPSVPKYILEEQSLREVYLSE